MAAEPPAKKARLNTLEAAHSFLDFVNKTGSPYHTVSACVETLRAAGFQELPDGTAWELKRGGKYFVTKNFSEIMAFTVGGKFRNDGEESGFCMIGTHSDSPCLRLRPNSKIGSSGMLQVGIMTYGGGMWHTWFDRPLGVAGKVIVRQANGAMAERLVHIPKPLMVLPNLAIHLYNAEEHKGFAPNKESNLQPVICSKSFDDAAASSNGRTPDPKDPIYARHHAVLLEAVAKELGCKCEDIVDADLCLMDASPSNLVGVYEEFISSPRIDNVVSTWAAMKGIADYATSGDNLANSVDICVAVSFDDEEVGSESFVGAQSETFPAWLTRILNCFQVPLTQQPRIYTRSFMVSADCAHGVHPNYAAKHQTEHRPEFHKGIVIKTNANQRYATTPMTASLFREICKKADVPVQDFIVRNDSPCGTTIGPISASKLGVRTIDVGAPQWSMHSIRETCATSDAGHLLNLCTSFYKEFRKIDDAAAQL